jgi:hypothetical protein
LLWLTTTNANHCGDRDPLVPTQPPFNVGSNVRLEPHPCLAVEYAADKVESGESNHLGVHVLMRINKRWQRAVVVVVLEIVNPRRPNAVGHERQNLRRVHSHVGAVGLYRHGLRGHRSHGCSVWSLANSVSATPWRGRV